MYFVIADDVDYENKYTQMQQLIIFDKVDTGFHFDSLRAGDTHMHQVTESR